MTYNEKDVVNEDEKREAEGLTEEQQKERLDNGEDIIGASTEKVESGTSDT